KNTPAVAAVPNPYDEIPFDLFEQYRDRTFQLLETDITTGVGKKASMCRMRRTSFFLIHFIDQLMCGTLPPSHQLIVVPTDREAYHPWNVLTPGYQTIASVRKRVIYPVRGRHDDHVPYQGVPGWEFNICSNHTQDIKGLKIVGEMYLAMLQMADYRQR